MPDSYSLIGVSMQADMLKIDASSQNLANANTPAYKSQISFSEWVDRSSLPLSSSRTDFSNGLSNQTNRLYDLALSGGGYFLVGGSSNQFLTRNGAFHPDQEGFLVSASGLRVQSNQGDIFIGDQTFEVRKDGMILLDGEEISQIAILQPSPNAALTPVDNGLFSFSDGDITGSLREEIDTEVLQGHLEKSNVDPLVEMLNLTKTLKHFELQQKVLRSYDSMIDVGITELGSF